MDNYRVEEIRVSSPQDWDNKLALYSDYNFYQAYGWGELKKQQGWNVARFACYRGQKDVALAQCLYKYYKVLNAVVIWVPGGPVFLRDNAEHQLHDLKFLLASIRERFKNKMFYARIYPMQQYSSDIILTLRSSGFQRPICSINHGLTYHINTQLSEEESFDNLTSNWRHNLRRSGNNELNFSVSDSKEHFDRFYDIYLQESKNNNLKVRYSKEDLDTLKSNLSSFGSLVLFLVFSKSEMLSGRLVCLAGRRMYDLVAAVTQEGRVKYATYALIWEMLKWARERNIEYFDIGGIDPFSYETVFNFKKGLGGKMTEYIGEWEFSRSLLLRVLMNWYVLARLKD